MSSRSTIRYTYQDYLTIPEDSARRHEIVDGELFVTPAPRARHQEIVTTLSRILGNRTVAEGLGKVYVGPIGVRLHEEGVVEPDLIFIRRERLEIVDPEGVVHGAPDLVVEVLSPSNRDFDRNVKRKQYMERGVPELWIVDADEGTVEVWKPGADRPDVVRDTLEWEIAERRFQISLSEALSLG